MIKICGITNRVDALAAVEAGASALGFNFYAKSPRYVTPHEAASITAQLPEGIVRVGVFVNETMASVMPVMEECGLDVAQFHGAQPQIDQVVPWQVWRAFAVDADWQPTSLDQWPADAYLLDAPAGAEYGGTGRSFDWTRARGTGRKVIVAGGLSPDNVAAAIATATPWGVDACSKLESSPGIKDHEKLRAFVRNAKAERPERQ